MKTRRCISVLLIFLFALSSASAQSGGFSLERGANGFGGGKVSALAARGETLYALTFDGLFEIAPEGTPKRLEWTHGEGEALRVYPSTMFSADSELYGIFEMRSYQNNALDFEYAMLALVTPEGDTAALKKITELDWSEMTMQMGFGAESYELSCAFSENGKLYGLKYKFDSEGIVEFDMRDGDYMLAPLMGAVSMAPYTEGKALVIRENGELGAVELDALQYEKIADIPSDARGLYYDAKSDTTYFTSGGNLMAMRGIDVSGAVSKGPLSIGDRVVSVPVVIGDAYAIADWNRVVSRPISGGADAGAVLAVQTIDNWSANETAISQFAKEHPEVTLKRLPESGDILSDMLSRSPDTDVYILSTGTYAYASVFERGYLAELTESEALSALVSETYPAVQDAVKKGGELYAFPLQSVRSSAFAYSENALAALGLTLDDVPETWPEFLEALSRAPEIIAADPDIQFLEGFADPEETRRFLFSEIMDSYIQYISRDGREQKFDTPEFRAIWSAFESVDFESLRPSRASSLAPRDYANGGILYSIASNVFIGHGNYMAYPGRVVRPLRIAHNAEPFVSASLVVAVVNPYSENRELAIEYIETLAENIEKTFYMEIMPGRNEPIPDQRSFTAIENLRKNIALTEEKLQESEGEQKQAIEERIVRMRAALAEQEAYAYIVSAESIAAYRKAGDLLAFTVNAAIDAESPEYTAITGRYMDGSISADEMIRALDQRLAMMAKEGK